MKVNLNYTPQSNFVRTIEMCPRWTISSLDAKNERVCLKIDSMSISTPPNHQQNIPAQRTGLATPSITALSDPIRHPKYDIRRARGILNKI